MTDDAAAPPRTSRQQIMQTITGVRCSARDLAHRLALPERQIEEHLAHIARTLARDRTRCFVMEPAACQSCGFVFRSRTRLTRPSRCPRCQSEQISAPRYEIQLRAR